MFVSMEIIFFRKFKSSGQTSFQTKSCTEQRVQEKMEYGWGTLYKSTITALLIWPQDGGRKENEGEEGLEIAGKETNES